MKKNVGDFALIERLSVNKNLGDLDLDNLVLELMDLKKGHNILDVACGNGNLAIKYLENIKDGNIYGIDLSKDLIDKAKSESKKKNLNIIFQTADALNLPFENNFFNRVSCNYAIYHFPDIHRALDEMFRVLKKNNAKLLLTGPSKNNNLELYDFHKKAGGHITEMMGRDVYEESVMLYLNKEKIKYKHTIFSNKVKFPSTLAFLDYYQKTKLFLDNVQVKERDSFLKVVNQSSEIIKNDCPILTKKIGVFEVWN